MIILANLARLYEYVYLIKIWLFLKLIQLHFKSECEINAIDSSSLRVL